jgi:small subunit ribosomal protein S8
MVTDPISDFLIRLQNASMARKVDVSLPLSQMKLSIAKILEREGYVANVGEKAKPEGGRTLTCSLIYKNGRPAISGVKRISKPSRRMYMGVRELRPIKRGHGLLVLSTPAGVLTGKEARLKQVGGEALFEIW